MEPDAEARKPLRARKTMALSSRAQARALGRGAAGDCAGGRPDAPKAPPGPGARPFLSAGALQDVLRRWYEREPARASPPPEHEHEQEGEAAAAAGPPGGAERKRAASRGDEDVLSKRIRAPGGPAEGGPASSDPVPPGLGKVRPTADAGLGSARLGSPPGTLAGRARGSRRAASRGGHAEALGSGAGRRRRRGSGQARRSLPAESSEGALCGLSCSCWLSVTPVFVLIACFKPSAGWKSLQVKSFIQNQLEISMGELHHGLQHLNERIARTQCLRKHEGIAIKIVKKISRLDRRINAVVSFQNTKLSRKVNPAEAQSKLSNGATLLPSMADSKPAPSKKPATETLSPTTGRSSDADDFPRVEALKKSSGVLPATAPVPPAKAAAGSRDSPAEQTVSLINSIDEGSNTYKEGKKKFAEKRPSAHESLLANLLQPARQSPNQVPLRFPHLPPLPSVESDPEHAKNFRDTLPPQKLKLAVAQVHQPKGIALQWDVSRADPRCAPIESFSLFICLEDADSGATGDWRTNVIKALPLPMACSLSQFPHSAKCYITMQSKDIHGRYGPFCEIQSISAL